MNSIFTRRSIRRYTNKQVSDEYINLLLRAAMSAPSAGNERPWHFLVIKDHSTLQQLSKTHFHASMVALAQAAIIICADLNLEIKKGMWVQDSSAAAENILIEATELGLGAVWVGVYPREERVKHISNLFMLPNNIIPFCIIPFGYPDEQPESINRFDQTRIHFEKW
ncbi:MAG: nitroreductase family protein [Ignavibacteriales bacterium]|nr:nitroreductase family protein [Ignavibacteriales bacterium]